MEFSSRKIASQPFLGIRAHAPTTELPAVIGQLFGEIYDHIQEQGLEPSGMPLAIYHSMEADAVELECAMPLAEPVAGSGRIRSGNLPAGLVATATHVGPYHELPGTWSRLTEWMAAEGLEPAGSPWEVYVTDPGAEPDSSKWRTDIFFPVCG